MTWMMVGLLIRSALVMLCSDWMRRLPRHTSPTYRNNVLVTGFVLLLLWPAFPAFVPEIFIPLKADAPLGSFVTVQQTTRMSGHPSHFPVVFLPAVSIWMLGAFCLLTYLAVGHVQALRIRRRAVAVQSQHWHALTAELAAECGLGRTPAVLIGRDLMPQTIGLLRPSVVLPSGCLLWSESKRRSVLLHEFAHIKRKDTSRQLFVSVVTALWWFQPLCWAARRWVRAESEQACDVFVLRCGVKPTEYAAELLAIAKDFQFRPHRLSPYSASALPMADPASLELRLRSILNVPVRAGRERSAWLAMLTLVMLALTTSAVSVGMDGHLLSKGGVSMRRTLFSGLLTSASLSAAAIGGSVLDPSGAAVLDAKASIYNPETKARQETMSMADGKFGFQQLAAGQYILRVEKEGFAPILREFNVHQDSTVERGLTLQTGSTHEAIVTTANTPGRNNSAPGEPKPIRVGGELEQGNLITKVQPLYPAAAKSARVQGQVVLDAVISAEGIPEDVQVVSSPSDDLSQSALEAVRQWRYRPVWLNGNPVEIETEIVVNYTLAP